MYYKPHFYFYFFALFVESGGERNGRNVFEAGQMSSSVSTAIVFNDESEKVNTGELPQFTFEMLATATDHFHESNLLGKGGFGPVYKVQSSIESSLHPGLRL